RLIPNLSPALSSNTRHIRNVCNLPAILHKNAEMIFRITFKYRTPSIVESAYASPVIPCVKRRIVLSMPRTSTVTTSQRQEIVDVLSPRRHLESPERIYLSRLLHPSTRVHSAADRSSD